MYRSIFFLSLVIIWAISGCAWQPETINPQQASGPSTIVGIEIDSSRSLTGVEHTTEYVYPSPDSVQYIILNGKIVWTASPLWMDSLAPYHIDGAKNTITVVWPSVSRTDTESFQNLFPEIVSPAPGDTIVRSKGVTIQCPTTLAHFKPYVDLDDGIDTLDFFVDSTGVLNVSDTTLMQFNGPMLRITLNVDYTSYDFFPGNLHSTSIEPNRSIQYPMK